MLCYRRQEEPTLTDSGIDLGRSILLCVHAARLVYNSFFKRGSKLRNKVLIDTPNLQQELASNSCLFVIKEQITSTATRN
jgi:hypothetical protein